MERIGLIFFIGVLGVIALYAASHGHEHATTYWIGIAFFIFSVLLNFKLIAVHDEHSH